MVSREDLVKELEDLLVDNDVSPELVVRACLDFYVNAQCCPDVRYTMFDDSVLQCALNELYRAVDDLRFEYLGDKK